MSRDQINGPSIINVLDLLTLYEAICELQFTMGDDQRKYDTFMLLKNLSDVIGFHTYRNGTLTKVAEFYVFINRWVEEMDFLDKEDDMRLMRHIKASMNAIHESLKAQEVFKQIDFVNALITVPRIDQELPDEKSMKIELFRFGAFINISLRGNISPSHELIRAMLELLDLMRKSIYGRAGVLSIKPAVKDFIKKWEKLSEPYKNAHDFSIGPIIMDMPGTIARVSKILDI